VSHQHAGTDLSMGYAPLTHLAVGG
jgi:hypothetical protein